MGAEVWEILVGRDHSLSLDTIASRFTNLTFQTFHFHQVTDLPVNVSMVVCHVHRARGEELRAIACLKERFASVPFICIAPEVDRFLCVWALRARMWDVIDFPHEKKRLIDEVEALLTMRGCFNIVPRSMVLPGLGMGRGSELVRLKTQLAIEYIASHYGQKLHAKEMAALCGTNAVQFARLFKKEQGCTFRDYVKTVRLGRAQFELAYTDGPIQNIAFNCGYEEISAFNRIFKTVTGMTPTEYRNWASVEEAR